VVKPRRDYWSFLKNGEICKYKVVFPSEAQVDDEIVVKASKLTRIKMTAVDTYRYKSTNFTETILHPGQNLTVKHPNVLFIVLLSDIISGESGDFKFSYEYFPKIRTQ
jgi:hypothetical protein